MSAKPVPDGYHTLTPFLTVRDAARAIEFYKQAFGATGKRRCERPRRQSHARAQKSKCLSWTSFGATATAS